jgi:hypothetical protein
VGRSKLLTGRFQTLARRLLKCILREELQQRRPRRFSKETKVGVLCMGFYCWRSSLSISRSPIAPPRKHLLAAVGVNGISDFSVSFEETARNVRCTWNPNYTPAASICFEDRPRLSILNKCCATKPRSVSFEESRDEEFRTTRAGKLAPDGMACGDSRAGKTIHRFKERR